MGNTFSYGYSKTAKRQASNPLAQTIAKEVSFLENPITDIWSQSPRNSDEFYKFDSKTDVNRSQKKTRSKEEKKENKTKRNRSISRYYEIKRHTDLVDDFKPKKGGNKRTNKRTNKRPVRRNKTNKKQKRGQEMKARAEDE